MIFVLIGKVNKIEPNLYHDRVIIIQQQVHILFFLQNILLSGVLALHLLLNGGSGAGKCMLKYLKN